MDEIALKKILQDAIDKLALKKAVFSKPRDREVLKADAKPVMLKNGLYIQFAKYHKDGKVFHKNIPAEGAGQELYSYFEEGFGQMNIITASGDCQAMLGKDGKLSVVGQIRPIEERAAISVPTHDKAPAYILKEEPTLFLQKLGVMDESGHVYDKKRAKFRQINKFLEVVGDTLSKMSLSGSICVYDLCCGKGYLTFAVYHYLKNIRKLDARVFGVDLKKDVMEYCEKTARELGFDGLSFSCDDIAGVRPQQRVDLVIALHACDTATDIALSHAVKWNAEGILSAPCCQHELAGQMKSDVLGSLFKQNILRYRFAQLCTDALRCELLEACGYGVTAMEFVDPDETDKNLMIKAVRLKKPLSEKRHKEILEDYAKNIKMVSVSPSLETMLGEKLIH